MPNFKYAFKYYDKTRHVRSSLRESDISPKHAREIAISIKGLSLEKARELLQDVINLKRVIPMRKYNKQVAHKAQPGVMAGRYPVKAASRFLKLLDNLESNAEYKGMDLDRIVIISANTHRGVKIRRFIPRAFGRATSKNNTLTHVELVAKEQRNVLS